jgi:uncharacterized membrane protein YozB (DUF420 family)
MSAYLEGAGFLVPHSSIGADLSLVIIIAAFVMLTLGVVLAKSKRYEAHRWVQTSAVVLGLFIVVRASQLAAKGQSLRRYKNAMRVAYVVYLIATALGIWVYLAIYG